MRIIKNRKCLVGIWKCDWVCFSYFLGWSGRREEICEWGKGFNDFERIEWGVVWGENFMYGFVEW